LVEEADSIKDKVDVIVHRQSRGEINSDELSGLLDSDGVPNTPNDNHQSSLSVLLSNCTITINCTKACHTKIS